MVVITSALIPFRIAYLDFTYIQPSWVVFDILSDIIFIIDMVITFFTSEDDKNGVLILTLKGIAQQYVKGWFAVDLLSSVPVSTIIYIIQTNKTNDYQFDDNLKFSTYNKALRVFRIFVILKTLRILRQSKIIELITSKLFLTPNVNSVIFSFAKMITLLHFIGCSWGIVAVSYQYSVRDNWMRSKTIEDDYYLERYLTSCYWGAITINAIGYGDITPTNQYEVAVNVFLMWFGVTAQSYIISRITEIYLDKKEENESVEQKINSFLKKSVVATNEQDKVLHFYKDKELSNFIFQLKRLQLNQLINILPMYLKAEFCYYIY